MGWLLQPGVGEGDVPTFPRPILRAELSVGCVDRPSLRRGSVPYVAVDPAVRRARAALTSATAGTQRWRTLDAIRDTPQRSSDLDSVADVKSVLRVERIVEIHAHQAEAGTAG